MNVKVPWAFDEGEKQQVSAMVKKETVCQWCVLLLSTLSVIVVDNVIVEGCLCPVAEVLTQFPLELPAGTCCLNFSGSTFTHVPWSTFTNKTNVEILDLSHCGISHIDMNQTESPSLREVYLNHNKLTTLPGDFLAGHHSLKVLHLGMNLLQELPDGFLQGSDNLQVLDLQRNQLSSLPESVLRIPSLQRLELGDNPWDCSCQLMGGLGGGRGARGNKTTTILQDLVVDMTCSSPWNLAGRNVQSVRLSDVCRPPGLTALFILLPLLILTALVLCWWCGKKKKKKETLAFGTTKKGASSSTSYSSQKHRSKLPSAARDPANAEDSRVEGILKNQLLLRPSSTLLGSTRDIYEEVEIKMGSVESLRCTSSRCSSSTEGRQGSRVAEAGSKAELDTESVTEVMKDSTDREKAYLTQATEYYSLVPGIELDDSDHGEYETVDLS